MFAARASQVDRAANFQPFGAHVKSAPLSKQRSPAFVLPVLRGAESRKVN